MDSCVKVPLFPETSENFHALTLLSVQEDFIDFCCHESFKTWSPHLLHIKANLMIPSMLHHQTVHSYASMVPVQLCGSKNCRQPEGYCYLTTRWRCALICTVPRRAREQCQLWKKVSHVRRVMTWWGSQAASVSWRLTDIVNKTTDELTAVCTAWLSACIKMSKNSKPGTFLIHRSSQSVSDV